MPTINLHGTGSGASSPIPGAKFGKINTNLTRMQEEAGQAALQSAVPWPSDRFKKINDGLARMLERDAAKAAAAAKVPMESSIPWMNPRIRRFNDSLTKTIEKDAALAQKAAQQPLTSSIPWMNRNILRYNTNIQKETEKQASAEYKGRQKEFSDSVKTARQYASLRKQQTTQETKEFTQNARFVRSMAALKERTQKATFGQTYREATAENRERGVFDPNTYRAANASRLGSMGQRAADRGNWRELAASERELNTLEKRHGRNPGVARSIRIARMQISAGKEGISPFRLAAGQAYGRVADMATNPALLEGLGVAGAVAGAAWEGVKLPLTMASNARSILGLSTPYNNMRLGLAGMGRAGNLNSRNLEDMLSPTRSGGNPEWLNSLGLDGMSATQLMQSFAIVPSSAGGMQRSIQSIAGAQYMPGLGGLDQQTYVKSANLAQNLGLTTDTNRLGSASNGGLDGYFRKLQQITSVAVAMGMDRSQAISNVENILRQSGATGASIGSGQAIVDMATKLMQAGTPGARSGFDASNIQDASINFAKQLGFGGSPLQNTVAGSYIGNVGGNKAFTDPNDTELKRLMGRDAYNAMAQQPGGAQRIMDLHQAAASGNSMAVVDALGNLINGNADASQYMYNHSVYGQNGPQGYMGNVARRNALGIDRGADADRRATLNSPTSGATVGGLNGNLTRGMRNNNPLNLSYRNGQGAIGTDGRFGVYGTMEAGVAADTKQLLLYQDRDGLNTVRGIISKWAPKTDGNDVASYVAQVSKQMGVDPDAPLNLHDTTTAQSLVMAMARRESGMNLDTGVAQRGVAMALGQPQQYGTSPYGTISDPNAAANDVTATNRQIGNTGAMTLNASTSVAKPAQSANGIGDSLVKVSTAITQFDSSIGQFSGAVDRFVKWMDGKDGTAAAGPRQGMLGLAYSNGRPVLPMVRDDSLPARR